MRFEQAELRSNVLTSGTSGVSTEHPGNGGATVCPSGMATCGIACENCPWVDFRDYDQCGLTFGRHCPGHLELVASS